MIAKIKVDKYEIATYNDKKRESFLKFCRDQEIELPPMDGDTYFNTDPKFIADINSLAGCGFPFVVLEFVDIAISKNILGMLSPQPTQVTNHININNYDFLYKVDEVMLLEDYCTDSLKEELLDGWRIISICGAYKQRRPDYIMGRNSKEKDDNGS